MIIAETRIHKLGKYTVRQQARFDNPAFAQYTVFNGDRRLGAQFSMPSEEDCRRIEREALPHPQCFEIPERKCRYGRADMVPLRKCLACRAKFRVGEGEGSFKHCQPCRESKRAA